MNYDGSYEAPDGIEPLIGYRGWLVRGGKLVSCYRMVEWPVGGPLESMCLTPTFGTSNERGDIPIPPPPKHSVSPNIFCTCGIYGLDSYPNLWEVREGKRKSTLKPWPFEAITGIIKVWGKVVVGSRGFRAQYAEPIALVARSRMGEWPQGIEEVAGTYGIEVVDAKEVKA